MGGCLLTRSNLKHTPNGGFETTDFKTAALSFSVPLGRKPVTLAPRPRLRHRLCGSPAACGRLWPCWLLVIDVPFYEKCSHRFWQERGWCFEILCGWW